MYNCKGAVNRIVEQNPYDIIIQYNIDKLHVRYGYGGVKLLKQFYSSVHVMNVHHIDIILVIVTRKHLWDVQLFLEFINDSIFHLVLHSNIDEVFINSNRYIRIKSKEWVLFQQNLPYFLHRKVSNWITLILIWHTKQPNNSRDAYCKFDFTINFAAKTSSTSYARIQS